MARQDLAELAMSFDMSQQELRVGLAEVQRDFRQFNRNVGRELQTVSQNFESLGRTVRASLGTDVQTALAAGAASQATLSRELSTARDSLDEASAAAEGYGEELSTIEFAAEKVRESLKEAFSTIIEGAREVVIDGLNLRDVLESIGDQLLEISVNAGLDILEKFFTRLIEGIDEAFAIVAQGIRSVIIDGMSLRDALSSVAEQLFNLSVETGLGNLSDFVNGVIDDIDFVGLFGGIAGLFGGGGSGPGLPPGGTFTSGGGFMLAAGGPARAGQPYIVGERGPELFVPNMNGMVVPNHKLRGSGVGGLSGGGEGITNVFNIDARGSEVGVETRIRQELSRAVPSIVNASVQATVERRQRNPRLFS